MPTMPIKTYLQGWDAHAPGKQRLQLVSNDVTTLEGQVDQAWADNTAKTRAQLKARIESPVEYKNDEYRGYDTVCQLAPSGSLTIGSGGLDKYGNPNLTFFYATSGSVEFTATQPYVDKWGDPRLSLSFNLTARLSLSVNVSRPDGSQPDPAISLITATASITSATLTPVGPIADAVKQAVDWYKGPLFLKSVLDALTRQQVQLPIAQQQLAGLNAKVRATLGTQYRLTGAVGVPSENSLYLFVTNAWQGDAAGVVNGDVVWENGKAAGPNDCGAFGFAAQVQTGPAPVIAWPEQDGVAPTQSFPATQSSFSGPGPNGNTFCQFTIANLPSGLPATVAPTRNIGKKGAFFSLVAALTPARMTVTPNPAAVAEFHLKTQAGAGTGLTKVQTVPTPDAGDPAGNVATPATTVTQAPVVQTAPATGNIRIKNLRKFLGDGQQPAQQQQLPQVEVIR